MNSTSRLFGMSLGLLLLAPGVHGQIAQVLFSEDFEGAAIDTTKFQPDAPFFEGGIGDIAATQSGGVVEFTGTVSQQWWAGATLRTVPTFDASAETNLVVSVDRVSEAGAGTASRSALWIMDETQTRYILFADVRGEEGWRYNRKIGVAGDAPTGGGTIITQYDGAEFDDGGLHRMKAVANGSTVRLYLDDIAGPEVLFPFNKVLFHIGSYARATGDTAYTVFDNFRIESVGTATFSTTSLTLGVGQTAAGIQVRIPTGANATSAVTLRVVSSSPATAIPVGAAGDTLTLTFPAGGANVQNIDVQALAVGGANLTLVGDAALSGGNILRVTAVPGPGVRLTEEFTAASIDSTKWEVNEAGFEAAGLGTFTTAQTGGRLEISGTIDQAVYWDGASYRTVNDYVATADLPLTFEVDRVSVDPTDIYGEPSSGARTGVYITTADRSQYVFFGQNLGENGWQVNVNPGTPTGAGTALVPFAALNADTGNHRLKLVADGSSVEVFLNGQSGGKFPFAVSAGIRFEVGAYARDFDEQVVGVFDNVRIANTLPCITATPSDISTVQGDNGNQVKVTIPKLLNGITTSVTVTSRNPAVAIPEGAVNGSRVIVFPAGTTNAQSFRVQTVGVGTTTFDLTDDQGTCIANGVSLTITPPPVVLFSDNFAAATIDAAKWFTDTTPLVDTGVATLESGIVVDAGVVKMVVTNESGAWPGFALTTVEKYTAAPAAPAIFEVDRTKLDFVLVTGTGAQQRAGLWVLDSTRTNYVFFCEYATHDGTAGGWQYNRQIGQAGDSPVTAAGISLPAFGAANFNDRGNHRMKATANGSTVKLYLDGELGAEVAFPFAEGLTFGFGAYVAAATDVVTGSFDNAQVSGVGASLGALSATKQAGNIVISWTGAGTLQSADALGNPAGWANVTPAPTGTTYTVTPAGAQKYYRLRQ